MKKITCITPTLWLSKEFETSCTILYRCDTVAEVIIIDNNSSNRNIDFTKFGKPIESTVTVFNKTYKTIRFGKFLIIDAEKNLFVSEPWNMGAKLASYPLLCILNDDVIIDSKTFKYLSKNIDDSIGIVGLDYTNYNYTGFNPVFREIVFRPYAFGCCMFILKNKYVQIPDDIKVFFNDDFLLYKIKGKKLVFSNVEVRGSVSTSINDPKVSEATNSIKQADEEAFRKIISQC